MIQQRIIMLAMALMTIWLCACTSERKTQKIVSDGEDRRVTVDQTTPEATLGTIWQAVRQEDIEAFLLCTKPDAQKWEEMQKSWFYAVGASVDLRKGVESKFGEGAWSRLEEMAVDRGTKFFPNAHSARVERTDWAGSTVRTTDGAAVFCFEGTKVPFITLEQQEGRWYWRSDRLLTVPVPLVVAMRNRKQTAKVHRLRKVVREAESITEVADAIVEEWGPDRT